MSTTEGGGAGADGRPARNDGAAPPIPPLEPGEPPLAILVDYDGTIALTDVSDTIMAEHVPGLWESEVAAYDAGQMGSRRLMELEMALVDTPVAELLETAAAQPHDPGFVPFVRRAQAAGIPVEVVSDGFGFFIEPALVALGVGELPVISARTTFDGRRASIAFPNGHPTCFVCGTCKRNRVLEHQAAGRAVVFIGDGESDRYAAGYADLVWAKRSLVRICIEAGWNYRRWTEFREIDAWLESALAAWRGDPGSLPGPPGQAVLLRSGGLGRRSRRPGPRRVAAEDRIARVVKRQRPGRDLRAIGLASRTSRRRSAMLRTPRSVVSGTVHSPEWGTDRDLSEVHRLCPRRAIPHLAGRPRHAGVAG